MIIKVEKYSLSEVDFQIIRWKETGNVDINTMTINE